MGTVEDTKLLGVWFDSGRDRFGEENLRCCYRERGELTPFSCQELVMQSML